MLARTRWHLITFLGPKGGESVGIVDLLAARKDHGKPRRGMKRGDALQFVFIQVKGGRAAMPKLEDRTRLSAAARWHKARDVLLATQAQGTPVRFFRLCRKPTGSPRDWSEIVDLPEVFR